MEAQHKGARKMERNHGRFRVYNEAGHLVSYQTTLAQATQVAEQSIAGSWTVLDTSHGWSIAARGCTAVAHCYPTDNQQES